MYQPTEFTILTVKDAEEIVKGLVTISGGTFDKPAYNDGFTFHMNGKNYKKLADAGLLVTYDSLTRFIDGFYHYRDQIETLDTYDLKRCDYE